MLKYPLIIIFLFTLSGCGFQHYVYLNLPDGLIIKTKRALTEEERISGLSGLSEMSAYRALLYTEKEPRQTSMWMKGMLFSLDMVFLDEDKKVLEIKTNLPPCAPNGDCPSIYSSSTAVKYVMEIGAGEAEAHGIKEGIIINW